MPNVRTQCREAYTPRAISKGILKALVEALVDFKPGLPTTSRKIKARAISAGKSTELEGPECWKVTDPHSLAELETSAWSFCSRRRITASASFTSNFAAARSC